MKKIELIGGEHAVLLIHGLQGTPIEMQSIAKRLHKASYSVHVPHFKGYGYSTRDSAHSVTPWRDWRGQVLHELRGMKRQYKTVSVGGLCIGAVLALSVAEEASASISGLSLLSTTLFYDGWSIPGTVSCCRSAITRRSVISTNTRVASHLASKTKNCNSG